MKLSAPPTCRQVACCAHRGDSSRYRENTLPAVRSAVAHRAEFVEVDARVARDGTVVLLHDPSLVRLWGHAADVADLTWPQLQHLGGPVWRIPLLEQVLELFVDAESTLLIDLDSVTAARAVYEVTRGSEASVAFCGDRAAMETIRRLDPAARIWWPWDSTTMPTRDDLANAPEFLNVDARVLSQGLVDQAHALGVRVAVWTLDDEAAMRRAFEWAVDSVTTNQLLLLRALRESVDPAQDGASLAVALWTARELASWAGRWTRTAQPGRIETKEHAADLVTEVDVSVEQHVRAVITEWFPAHDIVGEELGGSPREGQPCWYLDPVDGTTNVANRLPWSAFSLALAVDGVPLVGVVADPWRSEIFEAVRGRGARLNGRPLRLGGRDRAATPPDPLTGRVVSTELDAHRAWPGMLELLAALGERHCTLRIMGSGTMTLVGIAAGRGVGAVIGQYGPMDHLAAALIVHEAGGVVWDDSGKTNLFPTSGGIMAATPVAAPELFSLWQRHAVLQHT